MIAGKDGVLQLAGPAGAGLIFVHTRKILAASYAGKQGIAAIAALDDLKDTGFKFFVGVSPQTAELNLATDALHKAIEAYRDELGNQMSM